MPLLTCSMLLSIYWIYSLVTSDEFDSIDKLLTLTLMIFVLNGVVLLFMRDGHEESDRVELSREEAPALWSEIDRISQHADCPPVKTLIIDHELNASAGLSAKRGLFGKRDIEVTMGLPLMMVTTPQQAASVVAHEIGHHNGEDGRRGLAIYHAQMRTKELTTGFDMGFSLFGLMLLPMRTFFLIYGLSLSFLSCKLRHQNEYDADTFAAAVCGAQTSAETGMIFAAVGEDVQDLIWKPVMDAFDNGTELPKNALANLSAEFSAAIQTDKFKERVEEALKQESNMWESHPSLKDRIANVGAKPVMPDLDISNNAAKAWFGDGLEALSIRVQECWMRDVKETWGEAHSDRKANLEHARRVLSEVDAVLSADPRNAAAWIAKCSAAIVAEPCQTALAVMRQALQHLPDQPDIRLMLAELEAQSGMESGLVRAFDLLAENNSHVTKAAHALLRDCVDNARYWEDEFPDFAKIAQNDEIAAAVAALKSPAHDTQHELSQWSYTEAQRANLPAWHERLIRSWCSLNPHILKVWLFVPIENNEIVAKKYFMVVSYRSEEEMDYYSDPDTTDFALVGPLLTNSNVRLEELKSIGLKMSTPKGVYECLQTSAPIYDQQAIQNTSVPDDAHGPLVEQIAA